MSTNTNSKLTAQQRAMLFGANTRQHFQMLGSKSVNGASQSITFDVPQTRLLQSVKLYVEAEVKASDTKNVTYDYFYPYRVFRRLSIDFNNGFSPFVVSGENLALLNSIRINPDIVKRSPDGDTLCKAPNTIGTDNTKVSFLLEMPLTLNDRDPVGLVMAQSKETNITVQCDIAPNIAITTKDDYTRVGEDNIEIMNVKVTPMLTSFSIPSSADAFPDMSVLKVVGENKYHLVNGTNDIALQTGMIYRKLMFKISGEGAEYYGAPDKETCGINGNFEIVFNGADVPYSISPAVLRMINTSQLGYALPVGVYMWDFSNQGIPNLGGSRDYIDSEKLTELHLRFNIDTTKWGEGVNLNLEVVSEKLSRLIG